VIDGEGPGHLLQQRHPLLRGIEARWPEKKDRIGIDVEPHTLLELDAVDALGPRMSSSGPNFSTQKSHRSGYM